MHRGGEIILTYKIRACKYELTKKNSNNKKNLNYEKGGLVKLSKITHFATTMTHTAAESVTHQEVNLEILWHHSKLLACMTLALGLL